MKKIEGFIGVAPKMKSGSLEYCLWIDKAGVLYVQMLENIDDEGTHSKNIFLVSDILNMKSGQQTIRGKNPVTFVEEEVGDNNNFAFLKAVVRHLVSPSQPA